MNRTWTAVFLLALAALPAGAVDVELLSRVPPRRASETASGASHPLAISADGRYTALASEAVNLVPGMAAEPVGVYLYLQDRVAGEALRIGRRAVTPLGLGSYGMGVTMSADGRFVAFESQAADEVDGQEDGDQTIDVFLWDRVTGESELVSRADGDPARTGNGESFLPVVSADGRFVVFSSTATDLVDGIELPAPGAPRSHLFLWDRKTGEVVPVTRSAKTPGRYANEGSGRPSISADGRFVAFQSQATDLIAGQIDRNGTSDAFLWDRITRQTVLVSRAAASPLVTGNRETPKSLVSADGRFVALLSLATNLRQGQRGGGANVFLWERATGSMTLVSHGRNPENPALQGRTELAAVSANGSHVLFSSNARNLVPGERPPRLNVFLWSRASGRNTLLSRSTAGNRGGNGDSAATSLSADGAWAAFDSLATDLVAGVTDLNGQPDIFLANGRSGRITLLSGSGGSPGETAHGESSFSQISADGRWTAFSSDAPDLVAGVRDTSFFTDVVLADRQGGRTILTLHPPGLASATPLGESRAQSIDASGRFVVFVSTADASQLMPGVRDANAFGADVFLYDRQLRTVTLVTRSAADPGATADVPVNATSIEARISADGRWVAFASSAPDLVSGQSGPPGQTNIFLWDRTTGQTVLASRSAGSPTASGDAPSIDPEISADGSAVVFVSGAADLVPGQTGRGGVFVFDRTPGTVSLASRAAGTVATAGPGGSALPVISADGRRVAFLSNRLDLVPGLHGPQATSNLFVHDRPSGTTTLVSHAFGDPFRLSAGESIEQLLNADGSVAAFTSTAPDLVPRDFNRNVGLIPDAFAAAIP